MPFWYSVPMMLSYVPDQNAARWSRCSMADLFKLLGVMTVRTVQEKHKMAPKLSP